MDDLHVQFEAVRELEDGLRRFRTEAQNTVSAGQAAVLAGLRSSQERVAYWAGELERRQGDLAACLAAAAEEDAAGVQPRSCAGYGAAVAEAAERLAHARRLHYQCEEAANRYFAAEGRYRDYLSGGLHDAQGFVAEFADRLERAALTRPE